MSQPVRNVLIIGGGPAGYTAAIYASRAGLQPLLLEGPQPGGQLTITTDIENFPGFRDGIAGPELMATMRAQAERFGTEILTATVASADLSARPFAVETDQGRILAETVILATGASAKWLGLGKDESLSRTGGGVSACATCDGFFFRGREVAVVGGGDTALEEALYLTRFASRVHLVHRRDAFRASKAMQERALAHEKITIHWNKRVADLHTWKTAVAGGEQERLEGLLLEDTRDQSISRLSVQGLFVAIGHQPNTGFLNGQLPVDEGGYLKVEPGTCRTIIEGVFAAGDVADPTYRQAVTAAGRGCMAAIEAERWLAEREALAAAGGR
ncbi:thioredoxin-disulfide reductase [Mesoterricola sediminis]|uniref:Thioredoxin reductase n=1 Tax=Mesoterricola sediminis TaxID=2927980 RepID=A0AA48H6B8_9BACT|nr:thioredoxin-disulfide reductase [Mesoterricola sediminis]BDU78181.1 thioredoxin reductase [Mesoterricola sediminis]